MCMPDRLAEVDNHYLERKCACLFNGVFRHHISGSFLCVLCYVRSSHVPARAFMRGEGLTEEGGGNWRIDGSCSRGCRLRRSSKRKSGFPGRGTRDVTKEAWWLG